MPRAAIFLLCALYATAAVAGDKTDVILLKNGDRLTGDIKGVSQGKLTLKTNDAGTISIEWDKVVALKTLQRLQVEVASGVLHFGIAPEFGSEGQLRLNEGLPGTQIDLPLADIIALDPLADGTLLGRLDGYVTAGYSFTKSNDLQEFNLSGGVNAKLERRRWSIDGYTTFTAQTGRDSTQRAQLAGVYRWSLDNRWFWQAMGSADRNEELGLDGRGALGAGLGRYLVQTGHHEWAVYGGLSGTTERPTNAAEKESLEALVGTQYSFFQFDTPERTVSGKFEVMPSLTEAGRVRANAILDSRWEIVKDFIFAVSINAAYDSAPGTAALSHTDYGLVTSLGYTF